MDLEWFATQLCDQPPDPQSMINMSEVVCTTRLGGLLKSYSGRAA